MLLHLSLSYQCMAISFSLLFSFVLPKCLSICHSLINAYRHIAISFLLSCTFVLPKCFLICLSLIIQCIQTHGNFFFTFVLPKCFFICHCLISAYICMVIFFTLFTFVSLKCSFICHSLTSAYKNMVIYFYSPVNINGRNEIKYHKP